MKSYLTGNQLHILCEAWKHGKYVAPSRLYTKAGIRVDDVKLLHSDGYLNKRGQKYCKNAKTRQALEDHEFDVDSLVANAEQPEPEAVPSKKPAPEEPQDPIGLSGLQQMFSSERLRAISEDPEIIRQALLEDAAIKARAGDPWDYIRLQWPSLVITDKTDIAYFDKYLERKENKDLRLDDVQYRLIQHAFDISIREIAIKGCTSPGKGFATALMMNVWYCIYPNDRIVIVSTSTKHAQDVMFGEMVTWRRRMRYPGPGEILRQGIYHEGNEKHQVIIVNPETGEGLSGRHGSNPLFVIDESSGVVDDMIVQARKQARLIVCVSNPRVLSGWFYDLYRTEDKDKNQVIIDKGIRRSLLTFGGRDCLNVRARRLKFPVAPEGGIDITDLDGESYFVAQGEVIPEELRPHTRELIPNQMDYAKYHTIMSGPDPIERAWAGDGCFPPEDLDMQVIPPSWVSPCCELWEEHSSEIEVTAFGLDVGMSRTGDPSVLTYGGVLGIKGLYEAKKDNSLDLANWVQECGLMQGINLRKGEAPIAVDAVAVGDPFCDILEEQGMVVLRIKGSKSAEVNPQKYGNRRAELYGEFGERINPEYTHLNPFMIPADPKLREELSAPEKHISADGFRIVLTPKRKRQRLGRFRNVQSLEEKLGRSPDRADSAVLCYAAISEGEINEGVLRQLDPSTMLFSAREKIVRGEKVVETQYGDGAVSEMSQSEFIASWGSEEDMIEDEIAEFEQSLREVSRHQLELF